MWYLLIIRLVPEPKLNLYMVRGGTLVASEMVVLGEEHALI